MKSAVSFRPFAALSLVLALGACEAARTAPDPLSHPGGRAQATLSGAKSHVFYRKFDLINNESASARVAAYEGVGYGIETDVSTSFRFLKVNSASTPEKELTYLPQKAVLVGGGHRRSSGVVLLGDEDYRKAAQNGLQLRLTGEETGVPLWMSGRETYKIGHVEGFIPPEVFRDLTPPPRR